MKGKVVDFKNDKKRGDWKVRVEKISSELQGGVY